MTRNLFLLIFILGLAIGTNLFFSCSKVDSDDIPPTIELLAPLNDDTLFIYTDIDTILPVFSAIFKDDTGLSSYTFRIRHGQDSIKTAAPNEEGGDSTAYFYKYFQKSSIFGKLQDTIRNLFQIDSVITVTNTNGSKSRNIWEGVYQLDAFVADTYGNVTMDSINVVIVKTQYLKTK